MKASIIIPTFRRPHLLAKALASVARIRFPTDLFEVIVVNDGDRQTTEAFVRKAWTSKARLTYRQIRHQGLSAAVNEGIRTSTGSYFTILADDDEVLPNRLRVCCNFLDRHSDAYVVYTLPQYIDKDGNRLPTPSKLRDFLLSHRVLTRDHIRRGDGLWVHGTSTMYRREVVDRAGGWDETLETAEEYRWHLGLLKAGFAFHGVDAVTVLYRRHGGNKSKRFRPHKFPGRGRRDLRLRSRQVDAEHRFTGGARRSDPRGRGARPTSKR